MRDRGEREQEIEIEEKEGEEEKEREILTEGEKMCEYEIVMRWIKKM